MSEQDFYVDESGSVLTGSTPDGIPDRDFSAHRGDLAYESLTPSDFEPDQLRGIYRTMLLSRRLDDKMLNLLKQGKGFFHIGSAGHEAAQAAVALYSRPGSDWFCSYYRDLCTVLSLGFTSREVMLSHLAKAADPSSGGRQMAEHFGDRSKHIMTTSSSVGAQFLPALGFAMGVTRDGSDSYVYCSCGDGATSQGSFHEALNWAARLKAPVLFYVQDNKYAISVPSHDQTAGGTAYKLAAGYEGMSRARVDGTDFFQVAGAARAAINHLRAGKGPVCLVADVVRLLPHSSSDDHGKYRTQEELQKDRDIDPITLFEEQLLAFGIISSDDVEAIRSEVATEVEEAISWANEQADPDPETALRHVLDDAPSKISYATDHPTTGDPIVMVDAINHALAEEMEANPKILVYGEDVGGGKGGVFTATRNLTKKFGDDRCFNSPLAEASIVGTAVGLAASGWKPVVEIQFADYIWPAMQQLRNQVAPFRYRSNNDWDCPMVVRVPCGGYIHGGLCHSQNVESIFGHFPGLVVVMPSTAADAKGLLKSAIRGTDPVIFLEHKALYRAAAARSPEPDAEFCLPFGKARIVREGEDLTVVTYGMMVHKSMAAARTLAKEGISLEVIDIRTISPLDSETILSSVRKTNKAIVVYEDHEFAGFGGEIASQIGDQAFHDLDAPVKRLAGKFSFVPFADSLERAVLPQDEDVITAMRELVSY
ncbi:MAG: tungsten formylmethanofuran dehydrogenase [Rhodothermales bacterium]|nr:tungsten formylmethanofuran dehydrogenase [Rhodothermales bacterium]